MSLEDDLFNVPDNDDEGLYGNDEDVDMEDQDNNSFNNDNDNGDGDGDGEDNDDGEGSDDEGNESEEGDEDEDDYGEDNNDENGMNENEEDNDDDNADGDGEGDGDKDDSDDGKFMDAKQSQDLDPENYHKNEGNDGIIDDKEADRIDRYRQSQSNKEDSNRNDDDENNDMDVDGNENNKSNVPLRELVTKKAKESTEFDIVPSVSIPYTSQCHAMAFTDGPKWILTGGEDGFIRKYDFMDSVQGKSPLTMAQKHNLVDSVSKAGVICSYWENEQPLTKKELMESNPKIKQSDFTTGVMSYDPKIDPVYALETERNGYWCLSGVLSGGISLYTMRYNEGNMHHYFRHDEKRKPMQEARGHNDAVSALLLNFKQDKFLSGSWDKAIREWDLNTGKNTTLFQGSSGQVSNIQFRPQGLTDLVLSYEDNANDDEEAKENSDMGSLFGDSDNESNDNHELESQDKPKPNIPNKTDKLTNKVYTNDNIFMSSNIDGTVNLWDVRTGNSPVIRYSVPNKVPPWCVSSSWSNCGDYIYVGRRNSTVEEFSIKMPHKRHSKSRYQPNISRTLQFPKISGPVTALSTMPNNNFLLCGSHDNIRLYNLNLYNSGKQSSAATSTGTNTTSKKPATPFLIIPGHQGGVLSSLFVDDTGRFMVSASGNRGWGHANFTESVLIYEIDFDT